VVHVGILVLPNQLKPDDGAVVEAEQAAHRQPRTDDAVVMESQLWARVVDAVQMVILVEQY
jgi:hypothetical protein